MTTPNLDNAAPSKAPQVANGAAPGYRVINSPGKPDMSIELARVAAAVGSVLPILQDGGADMRWLTLAKEHLKTGFMCLNRAVTKPEGF